MNGISVGFANLTQSKESGATKVFSQGNTDDGSMGMRANVTIQAGLRGTELNAAVAHEGTHVLNAQEFIATFTKNAAWFDLSKNLTFFQTEMNAFRVTNSIYKSANQQFSTGCRGCQLGAGARTDADRDLAIKRILADPDGIYKVTPTNQGSRQFQEWLTPP